MTIAGRQPRALVGCLCSRQPVPRRAAPAEPGLLPVAEARDGPVAYWIGQTKPPADSCDGYRDCVTAPGASSLMRSDAIPFVPIPGRRPHPPTY